VGAGFALGALSALGLARLLRRADAHIPGAAVGAPAAASAGPAAPAGSSLTVAALTRHRHPAVLRGAHGFHGRRLALVPVGSTVKVIGDAKDEHGHRWYHVAVGPTAGWMHAEVLT
jgi:hypothetical protein